MPAIQAAGRRHASLQRCAGHAGEVSRLLNGFDFGLPIAD